MSKRGHCPRCQKALPVDWQQGDCPYCGIIFHKYGRGLAGADKPSVTAAHDRQAKQPLTESGRDVSPDLPATPPSHNSHSAPQAGSMHCEADVNSGFYAELDDEPSGLLARWWYFHRRHIAEWATTKMPYGYALILLLMVYWAIRYMFDVTYHSMFDGINLGIHEMGHLLFSFAGTFIMFVGGTFLQLAAPAACMIYFHYREEYFGSAFAATWLGVNCFNVAIYMADATDQFLDLVTVGGGVPMHDWHYLLSTVGLLGHEHVLAWVTRAIGMVLLWGGVVYGGWLVWQCHRHKAEPEF